MEATASSSFRKMIEARDYSSHQPALPPTACEPLMEAILAANAMHLPLSENKDLPSCSSI